MRLDSRIVEILGGGILEAIVARDLDSEPRHETSLSLA